jgi:hypothetical protein
VASVDATPPTQDSTLVYERVRILEGDEVIAESEVGEYGVDIVTRAALPYRFLHEDYVYDESTWAIHHDDGTREFGYRIWQTKNPAPTPHPLAGPEHQPGPPHVDEELKALVEADWEEDERHTVTVIFRGYPEWDVPPRARAEVLGEARAALFEQARAKRLAERETLYDQLSAPVFGVVELHGGEVVFPPRTSGYAKLSITKSGFLALMGRDDLFRISLDEADSEPGWPLGQGLQDNRVDAGDYVDNGHDGGGPPSGSAMRIAFIEHGKIRNLACGFRDGPGCTGPTRIEKLWDCSLGSGSSNYCAALPLGLQFPDPPLPATDNGNHGTMVVSAAAADYTEDQCEGFQCGDGASTPPSYSHSSTWELNASGYAPEARILYYGNINGNVFENRHPRHAEAFNLAVTDGADVISFSQGSGGSRCQPDANLSSEAAAEDAFDNGVLVAACTGNWQPSDGALCDTECGTWSVGSLAKTLSVAGFRANVSNCQSDFGNCRRDLCTSRDTNGNCTGGSFSSCRGGADVKIGATTVSSAASVTDVLMPTYVTSVTNFGPAGALDPTTGVVAGSGGGCSAATPQLAGLAATIKEYYLAGGITHVDLPGRLHIIMLNLADRSYTAQEEITAPILKRLTGAISTWGLGRVRARYPIQAYLSPNLTATHVRSFSGAGGTHTFRPFVSSTPMPSGVELVKCTALQMEDFTSDETLPVSISDIDLRIDVKGTQHGSCSPLGDGGSQTLHLSRSDSSADWKKMVAIESGDVDFSGKCVYVTLSGSHIETTGISVALTCTYAGALESEAGTP